ncbi:hypothetical protein HK102_006584 [Quaeritorhiza haematococci]|nr:hypothetical protein HK102_006584 [Quaeritorhiza haematococci]
MASDLFTLSPRCLQLKKALEDFVEFDCIPAETIFAHQLQAQTSENARWSRFPSIIEPLKQKARSLGLWNLFLSKEYPEGPGLTNLEYATLCEVMGRSWLAPEACNCSAPDTGNMEVLAKYGTPAQKSRWLVPLMEGKIRSAFAMTEPAVASSDATNIETSIVKSPENPDEYIINGRKWWISGAGDPRCKVFIVMGKSHDGRPDDPTKKINKHRRQSVIMVPADTPGITIVRPLQVFGYDDAPHGHMELLFTNVRVPASNIVLGEGRGFEVVQGRLGPGRIHHCMRTIGLAERCLSTHIRRLTDPSRRTFGVPLSSHQVLVDRVVESRLEIDQARMLVLRAADMMDKFGAKGAMKEIAMAKVVVPSMALRVVDRAIQAHGGMGVSQDTELAYVYAQLRTLRIADGPDEVHRMQIGRLELRRASTLHAHNAKIEARKREMLKAEGLPTPASKL